MASGLYQLAAGGPIKGDVAYDTDTFYVVLLPDTYTPDFDAHDYRNDLGSEISGTGYTGGGNSVTVTVGAFDTTNNRWPITLGGTTWTTSTITARYAAYYKSRGGASTADELIALNDFGENKITVAGTFTLNSSTVYATINA